MAEALRVGVIGVGSLGQHHARVYSELHQSELVGVYDANPKRAAEIARKNHTIAFETIEELAREIDAASVAVPTELHHDVAQVLMAHDVNLLVEKPIASTTADAEEMVRAAEEKGLILQVGHIERFNPAMEPLEKLVGEAGFIDAERLAPYPVAKSGQAPRGTDVSVVLDLMIHDLEVILHLVGSDVKEIHAIGVSVLSPTEDIANVRLCFENGCVANINASRISREKVRKIRVFQKNTYISMDYQNQSGRIYRHVDGRITTEKMKVTREEPLKKELSSFADCVLERGDPVVSGRHASSALLLAARICEHIREGGS